MGPDLANVFSGRCRLFRKIQGVSHLKATGDGHHLFPDPGEGKVGDKVVRIATGIHGHEVVSHGEHVPVAQKGAFGKGSGARGVKKEANFITVPFLDHLLKKRGFLFVQFLSQFLDLIDADEKILVVVAHALGIIPDDFFQLRAGIFNGKRLVHFFLRFTYEEFCVGVVDDVLDLLHHAVLKEPHPDAPGAHGGHFGPEPFGPVFSDHGHLVAPLEPQADHAEERNLTLS
jgi:hypothetical protein